MTDDIQKDTRKQVVPEWKVSESADKIVVKTKVKRGTGTRDEDKIDVKVKGDNPTEVVEKVNETISRLHNTADDLRNMQPENND